mgnify:CR=1 FL=1
MLTVELFNNLGTGSVKERIAKLKIFINADEDNLYHLLDAMREASQSNIKKMIELEAISRANKD